MSFNSSSGGNAMFPSNDQKVVSTNSTQTKILDNSDVDIIDFLHRHNAVIEPIYSGSILTNYVKVTYTPDSTFPEIPDYVELTINFYPDMFRGYTFGRKKFDEAILTEITGYPIKASLVKNYAEKPDESKEIPTNFLGTSPSLNDSFSRNLSSSRSDSASRSESSLITPISSPNRETKVISPRSPFAAGIPFSGSLSPKAFLFGLGISPKVEPQIISYTVQYNIEGGIPLYVKATQFDIFMNILQSTNKGSLLTTNPLVQLILLTVPELSTYINRFIIPFDKTPLNIWYYEYTLRQNAEFRRLIDSIKQIISSLESGGFFAASILPDSTIRSYNYRDSTLKYGQYLIPEIIEAYGYEILVIPKRDYSLNLTSNYFSNLESLVVERCSEFKSIESMEVKLSPSDENYPDIYFLKGNRFFGEPQFYQCLSSAVSGSIPLVELKYDEELIFPKQPESINSNIYVLKYAFLEAYLKAKINYMPSSLYNISVYPDEKFYSIILPLDSLDTLNKILNNLSFENIHVKRAKSLDDALVWRAWLNYPSLTFKTDKSQIFIAWRGEIPENPPATFNVEFLSKKMIDYLRDEIKIRDLSDHTLVFDFTQLPLADLIEIVVDDDKYAFAPETFEGLLKSSMPALNPFTKKPFPMKILSRYGYSYTGIFAVGPFKGFLETSPMREDIYVSDGKIVYEKEPYISPQSEISNLEGDQLQIDESRYFLKFYVDLSSEIFMELFKLFVGDDIYPSHTTGSSGIDSKSLSNDEKLFYNIETMWRRGYFLSDWSARYLKRTGKLSLSHLVIPCQIKENESITESRNNINFIESLSA